jgi:hypothetical protein
MVLENEEERHADMNIGTEEKREQSHNIRNRGRNTSLRFPEHTFREASALLHTVTNPSL